MLLGAFQKMLSIKQNRMLSTTLGTDVRSWQPKSLFSDGIKRPVWKSREILTTLFPHQWSYMAELVSLDIPSFGGMISYSALVQANFQL